MYSAILSISSVLSPLVVAIDFLLNREEAHNAMFQEAFNRVQDTGSNRDFGTTKAAKMYFSMSNPSPGTGFQDTKVTPPSFN